MPQMRGRWVKVATKEPTRLALRLLSAAPKRVLAKGWDGGRSGKVVRKIIERVIWDRPV